MSRLQDAIDQIVFARKYTINLLDTIDPSDWFRMPAEGVTHVAWQVGHLAMAQYRLGMLCIWGTRPGDDELIAPAFIKAFKRESVADPDPTNNPSPVDIRATFDRVHNQLMTELAVMPEADLDLPLVTPSRLSATRIECLRWCAAHEMLHGGQIGLLRRLFGHRPLW